LADAVAGLGGAEDDELRRQLDELNQFTSGEAEEDSGKSGRIGAVEGQSGSGGAVGGGKTKSNLANPTPPNLPLAILKMLEAYIVGLADVSSARGGWSEPKRDRALAVVKSLSEHLGEAERLASSKSSHVTLPYCLLTL
jgi:hypothetical protein